MTPPQPESAPVLSTPDTHIFDQVVPQIETLKLSSLDDEQLYVHYEIKRTVEEIRRGRWKRIALQFPDHMLVDAPGVYQALARGLKEARRSNSGVNYDMSNGVQKVEQKSAAVKSSQVTEHAGSSEEQLSILADTSYGACCVDEIAAEHADADVVVHYGRSCLSPTARLPVIYVFTHPQLDLDKMLQAFEKTYPDLNQQIILMADIPYSRHLEEFAAMLHQHGYTKIFSTSVIHDAASALPNRTVPPDALPNPQSLQDWHLFHVADPPPALLLTLASRLATINIYPAAQDKESEVVLANSSAALRRRYALLTRVSSVAIIGILINTLSVRSYLDMLAQVKQVIAAAGKKSYTFVVGKVNAAKIANFSEVGGWVVIGCWESSLFDSADFWKPIITPWELEIALKGDQERLWTGVWRSDFEHMLSQAADHDVQDAERNPPSHLQSSSAENESAQDHEGSEEESEPPEFDLRTGRYVSHSRPMVARKPHRIDDPNTPVNGTSLIKRQTGDVATVGGQLSPAAEFLRSKRTWQGLGSDFEIEYDENGALKPLEAATVEPGRSGIARGYVVHDDSSQDIRR